MTSAAYKSQFAHMTPLARCPQSSWSTLDEAAVLCVRFAGCIWIRAVVDVEIPACEGNLNDGVLLLHQVLQPRRQLHTLQHRETERKGVGFPTACKEHCGNTCRSSQKPSSRRPGKLAAKPITEAKAPEATNDPPETGPSAAVAGPSCATA